MASPPTTTPSPPAARPPALRPRPSPPPPTGPANTRPRPRPAPTTATDRTRTRRLFGALVTQAQTQTSAGADGTLAARRAIEARKRAELEARDAVLGGGARGGGRAGRRSEGVLRTKTRPVLGFLPWRLVPEQEGELRRGRRGGSGRGEDGGRGGGDEGVEHGSGRGDDLGREVDVEAEHAGRADDEDEAGIQLHDRRDTSVMSDGGAEHAIDNGEDTVMY